MAIAGRSTPGAPPGLPWPPSPFAIHGMGRLSALHGLRRPQPSMAWGHASPLGGIAEGQYIEGEGAGVDPRGRPYGTPNMLPKSSGADPKEGAS
jgi:hypothetical protein